MKAMAVDLGYAEMLFEKKTKLGLSCRPNVTGVSVVWEYLGLSPGQDNTVVH